MHTTNAIKRKGERVELRAKQSVPVFLDKVPLVVMLTAPNAFAAPMIQMSGCSISSPPVRTRIFVPIATASSTIHFPRGHLNVIFHRS